MYVNHLFRTPKFSDTEFILRYFYRSKPESEGEGTREASTGPDEVDEQSWGEQLLERDIIDEEGDRYSSGLHPIELWYGLDRFLLLTPAQIYASITSESRAKLLLSSAKIAVDNSKWYVLAKKFKFHFKLKQYSF